MKDVIPVGVTFYKEQVEKLEPGYELEFIHEPVFIGKKEYPNAIKIMHFGKQVGSLAESTLPESPQQQVLLAIKAGKKVKGEVAEIIVPTEQDSFKRTFKFDIDLDDTILMKSFNEDVVVEFSEGTHTYKYKGETLVSGSKYAGDDDFDKDRIAGYCSKSWGVPADDIKNMWESNANISRDFGSTVHAMLEHYNIYSNLLPMEEIERAKPKHPFLRRILNDYIDIVGLKNITPEVFVTYVKDGFCGQIDCLEIIGDKRCNLWDYKINILNTDKDKEGKNKLKKYQKQLSFYANVLEKTGWTVENIGAIVLEETWKVYKFDKLKIDEPSR